MSCTGNGKSTWKKAERESAEGVLLPYLLCSYGTGLGLCTEP